MKTESNRALVAKKKLFLSALMLGAALSVSAQSKYDHYYEGLPIQIEHVQEVKFPATSVNIAQYGAVPDGKTDCTEAFNKAIKELSKNKLPAKQIATLKAFSDGSADTAFTKILMSTNYPIYTDEGGTIEPALRNRLSILPFPKPMKNSDPDVSCFEDVHFENEKLGIIIWALREFSYVLNDNNRFCKEFEPNIYVDAESDQDQFGDKEEFQSNTNHSAESISVEDIIKKLFDLNNKENEEMTAECIMNAVNGSLPMDQTRISRSEEVGKVLRKIFGKELKSCRIKGITCYNLNWKGKIGDI